MVILDFWCKAEYFSSPRAHHSPPVSIGFPEVLRRDAREKKDYKADVRLIFQLTNRKPPVTMGTCVYENKNPWVWLLYVAQAEVQLEWNSDDNQQLTSVCWTYIDFQMFGDVLTRCSIDLFHFPSSSFSRCPSSHVYNIKATPEHMCAKVQFAIIPERGSSSAHDWSRTDCIEVQS
jgi:hypothetical protein